MGPSGPSGVDPHRARGITDAFLVAFFDRELKGRRAAFLDHPAEGFPEVLFEARQR
jgi:hypothetical protein